jgi:hypothetical protein
MRMSWLAGLIVMAIGCGSDDPLVGTWLACAQAIGSPGPTPSPPSDGCQSIINIGIRFTSDGRVFRAGATNAPAGAFSRDTSGLVFTTTYDGTYNRSGSHVEGKLTCGDTFSFDIISHGAFTEFAHFTTNGSEKGSEYNFHYDTNGMP